MTFQPWIDAVEMAKAARRPGTVKYGVRMLRTDAWLLLLLFRIRRVVLALRVPVVNRVLRMIQMMCGGVEIGNEVTLGSGVYFIHSLGTVVGGDARVGNRVRFMGGNTVGTARDNGYPVIEDDVEIGCGARILGPVRVGARAVIGANAVVITDVPAGAVAVGIPARIVTRAERPAETDLHLLRAGAGR